MTTEDKTNVRCPTCDKIMDVVGVNPATGQADRWACPDAKGGNYVCSKLIQIKSLYKEDLSLNAEGMDVKFLAQTFFEELILKYPDVNPYQFAQVVYHEMYQMACRRIIEWRQSGVIERSK